MYSVLSYGRMACDGVRIDAYARAIAQTVRPGSVVIDLGSGTGTMAMLALRAGAKRVYAVDLDPAVWLARDIAQENGYADQLVVHHGSSLELNLPEPADVVIADLRGSFPLFQQHLAVLRDARTRLLKPDGLLVPKKDRLFVAFAEADACRLNLEPGWTSLERHGFYAQSARQATLNASYTDRDAPIRANHLVSDAKVWGEIVYGESFERSMSATVDLTFTRSGTADVLTLWFEATLHEGIVFSNAPGHQLVYDRVVLPLLAPVRVAAGDRARVTLRADVEGNQWAWETTIGSGARVRQATFLGLPASPESLVRQSLTATPRRSLRGDRAARLLPLLDGERTVEELVNVAAAAEPERNREELVEEVKTLVRHYGR